MCVCVGGLHCLSAGLREGKTFSENGCSGFDIKLHLMSMRSGKYGNAFIAIIPRPALTRSDGSH